MGCEAAMRWPQAASIKLNVRKHISVLLASGGRGPDAGTWSDAVDGPLTGVRVLEVANWLAAPVGCALLADFGAEVVKVEPPTGDPYRGFQVGAMGYGTSFNFGFEMGNRGKRGITLDLRHEASRGVLYRLAETADVFVTNLLPRRRERYGVTYEEMIKHRADLVYVSVTGYGSWGPDQERPGYDYAAFWARSGIMAMMGEPDSPPPAQRPGMGDHATSLAVAGSVAMALLARQRTHGGQQVDISLHNAGLWILGFDVQAALLGAAAPKSSRLAAANPIFNSYRTRDDRWLMLVMVVSDVYWPQVCRAVGHEELEKDERFADFNARAKNRRELVALFDRMFAQRTLAEWADALDDAGCIWGPAMTMEEVAADPQSRARGAFKKVEHPELGEIELLDTPVKFMGTEVGARGPAPQLGQHTEEVLLEAGYSWGEIGKLRDDGAI